MRISTTHRWKKDERAVFQRRWLDQQASDMGKLDRAAIIECVMKFGQNRGMQMNCMMRLVRTGFITEQEGAAWQGFFDELKSERRVAIWRRCLKMTGSQV
jgi:hypothetical protein